MELQRSKTSIWCCWCEMSKLPSWSQATTTTTTTYPVVSHLGGVGEGKMFAELTSTKVERLFPVLMVASIFTIFPYLLHYKTLHNSHKKFQESRKLIIMGVVKAAIADGVLTFMWVFCSSTLGILTYLIGSAIGIGQGLAALFITTVLLFVLFFVFGIIGDLLGGVAFNPAGTAAFYAAGVGQDSLFTVATRFPAQAAGAVGGALAILEVILTQYKHMLGGPSLKVDLHNGAIAEGILTFVMTFLVFLIVLRGPRSPILKNWLLAMSTVTMVVAGSKYTGPSMNPANAFGWAYINNWHNTWEQFYVYWICPFIGAILAAWTFRALVPPPVKQKPKPKPKKA